MGYKQPKRRRRDNGIGYKWILPTALALLLLWLIGSSMRGKSPTEFFSDIYYWVVGSDSPNKSRAELKTIILANEFKVDSLSSALE